MFGSINSNISDHLEIEYNFAVDNNFSNLEYNNLVSKIKFGNFENPLTILRKVVKWVIVVFWKILLTN